MLFHKIFTGLNLALSFVFLVIFLDKVIAVEFLQTDFIEMHVKSEAYSRLEFIPSLTGFLFIFGFVISVLFAFFLAIGEMSPRYQNVAECKVSTVVYFWLSGLLLAHSIPIAVWVTLEEGERSIFCTHLFYGLLLMFQMFSYCKQEAQQAEVSVA